MRTRGLLTGMAALTGAGAGAALAVAGYTVAVVHRAHRVTPPYTFSPFEMGAPAEDVEFRSRDGLRLPGWWMDRVGSEWVVICAHGHQGGKADMLGIGSGLWRHGHSVLLFDFRGCGEADPGPQSLAHAEQRDLGAAIDYVATRRPDARIALLGFSMGAATSILVGADDDRVDLFVLDTAFAEMRDVIGFAYRRLRLPSAPLLAVVDLMTRATRGYRLAEVRPVDVVGRLSPRPVLLMHGADDRVTPLEHLYMLAEAAGDNVEVVVFPDAWHCGGYFMDRPGYIHRVAGFLQAWSTRKPPESGPSGGSRP